MLLQEIINTPFEIQIGENKVKVKKASLKDFVAMQEYTRSLKDDPEASIKSMAYAIKLCILKAMDNEEEKSKITDDFVMELIPLSEAKDSGDILTKLGFISPTKEVKAE